MTKLFVTFFIEIVLTGLGLVTSRYIPGFLNNSFLGDKVSSVYSAFSDRLLSSKEQSDPYSSGHQETQPERPLLICEVKANMPPNKAKCTLLLSTIVFDLPLFVLSVYWLSKANLSFWALYLTLRESSLNKETGFNSKCPKAPFRFYFHNPST